MGGQRVNARRPWTRDEMELLGVKSDTEVARLTGRLREAVARKRIQLKIASVPLSRHWADTEVVLLGTASDDTVAQVIGRSKQVVTRKRKALGIAPFANKPALDYRTQIEELILSGFTLPEIAEKLHCRYQTIAYYRSRYFPDLPLQRANRFQRDPRLDQMQAMRQEGQSFSRIAAVVGLSKERVRRILRSSGDSR